MFLEYIKQNERINHVNVSLILVPISPIHSPNYFSRNLLSKEALSPNRGGIFRNLNPFCYLYKAFISSQLTSC